MKKVIGTISIDASDEQVVILTFEGDPTDEDIAGYLDFILGHLRAIPAASFILDTRKAKSGTAKQRKYTANWMKTHHVLLSSRCAGDAFVVSNAIIRGILTAVFWMQPPPFPYVIVGTMSEATEWAHRQVGLKLSA